MMSRSPARTGLVWLGLSALVLVLDQWTKAVASGALDLYESVRVLPGLNWTLLHNTGAAFSFLSGPEGWQRWFFVLLAAVISVALAAWLRRTPREDWRTAAPLALIIGGAIGNVTDRLRFGHVVDFIDVYFRQWHWPAFNIADSAICVGAGLLVAASFRKDGGSQ